ncbi:hypothetical protein BU24DRAFT_424888 [Aaosphaeria arxii CBS 175.79]|uniref:Uncharacterized protein n=1 Tax=Aaosphaeria arxii CBS 175.79 TaxID=1450172 RepID=A0A6A5XNC5_9PLEO|nr:uncharacterized protein BU24DRAFT_424888 [Aaosphaeria arxii CBS 175.79]KAF2013854.1 hypothetical protein BU24DRAFT_424888 [Aaosphaeria arxii CBS 175.79]
MDALRTSPSWPDTPRLLDPSRAIELEYSWYSASIMANGLIRFKVYYLPRGKHISESSVAHNQKLQEGFFQHPVLVTEVDQYFVHFYALTRNPPIAIRDLKMCLQIGDTTRDEGPMILRLGEGSDSMRFLTWVNLEQRFFIEHNELQSWNADVFIPTDQEYKLYGRIDELEMLQNRFIYKPLIRDMNFVRPGTVVMRPNNDHPSTTFGSPIVVVDLKQNATGTLVRYFRIKEIKSGRGSSPLHIPIARHPNEPAMHHGRPVMFLEPGSPTTRTPSFVDLLKSPQWMGLQICQTWCYPPIQITQQSMVQMFQVYVRSWPRDVNRNPSLLPRWWQHASYSPQYIWPPMYLSPASLFPHPQAGMLQRWIDGSYTGRMTGYAAGLSSSSGSSNQPTNNAAFTSVFAGNRAHYDSQSSNRQSSALSREYLIEGSNGDNSSPHSSVHGFIIGDVPEDGPASVPDSERSGQPDFSPSDSQMALWRF